MFYQNIDEIPFFNLNAFLTHFIFSLLCLEAECLRLFTL